MRIPLLAALLACGILSAAPSAAQLRLDPSLIDYPAMTAQTPCQAPFMALFSGGRRLVFLASSHFTEPVPQNSPELLYYSNALASARPEGLLIESEPGSVNRQSAAAVPAKCYKDGLFTCGEGAYAQYAASRQGAAVYGGEPSPNELCAALAGTVPREDLLAFFSTRVVLEFKRRALPPKQWQGAFPEAYGRTGCTKAGAWNYGSYLSWLKTNTGRKPEEVDSSWLKPLGGAGANALQRAAYAVGNIREPLILKKVEELLNRHSSAMVIYGSSHFMAELPVLSAALGAPRYDCTR